MHHTIHTCTRRVHGGASEMPANGFVFWRRCFLSDKVRTGCGFVNVRIHSSDRDSISILYYWCRLQQLTLEPFCPSHWILCWEYWANQGREIRTRSSVWWLVKSCSSTSWEKQCFKGNFRVHGVHRTRRYRDALGSREAHFWFLSNQSDDLF